MLKAVKFGGSSLADAHQFQKVRDIILADPARRFVVPSAPGRRHDGDDKITDLLYATQRLAAAGEPIDETFGKIFARYTGIRSELGLSTDIESALAKVKEDILAGASADYAASRGEYLNGLLLADYLGYEFVDPARFILFDEGGRFLPEETNDRGAFLKTVERAVVPGFYGAKPNGSIHTFSRGGSDITGAIVARAIEADVYENWTDVSGFLMADPRIVHNPAPIRTVTYSELRELAYMGATVLHEESIFPVRQACIPINVRNTNKPEEDGTMIVHEAEDYTAHCAITGIAGKKGFTVINIEKDQMNTEVGFACRVLQVLAKHGVSIEHMPTGIDTLSVIVSGSSLPPEKRDTVINEIMLTCEPDSVEIHDDIALIAVVGRGMINRVGTSARIFTALSSDGVNIRMIDQGSSEMNIIIGVEEAQFAAAVNAIYYAFQY